MLTDEEIMAIRNKCSHENGVIISMDFAREIERAVIARAMPIPKQEPIAWMNNQGETTINEVQVEYWEMGGYKITPLYSAPQPAQAAAIPEQWREIVEAVAHVGIDFGYGAYELEQDKIDKARALLSASPTPQQSNK